MLSNSNSIVDNIYYFLWFKKEVGVKDSCLQVKIPDTIIMKGSNLLVWYFTSKKNGQILIRKDYQLTKEKVLQSFTKKVSKSGICAQYMYQKNEKFEMIKDKSEEKLKEDDELVIEYFNKEQLEQFLYEQENYEKENKNKKDEEKVKQKERPPRGILQKFIDPFGENQTVIQAIWSPQLCIFQKRLNYKNLYDQRWDPYERLVTFDGAEVYSRTVPLRGKIISQEMRKLCKNIAERVSLVSFDSYSLKRMVLYFKPDKNNVLHFLYCTSSRLEKEIPDPDKIDTKKLHHTPMVIEGSQFVRPEYVKLTYTTNTMRPVKLTNEIQCLNCKNLVQKTDLVDVEYKFIVETLKSQINQSYKTQIEVLQPREEQFVYDRQQIKKEFINGVQEDIPPFIKKLYPKITLEFYKEISKHKHFLSKQVLLCLNCYEDFVKKDPKSGFPREKQQDLRFVKKGMADKKSIFQKKDIKQIVAKKNMEMAQTNISKFQKPDVYQNIIDSLQEQIDRKNYEENDAEQRKQNLQKYYQKLNKKPSIKDRIQKVHNIIQKQTQTTNIFDKLQNNSGLQQFEDSKIEQIQNEYYQEQFNHDENQQDHNKKQMENNYLTLENLENQQQQKQNQQLIPKYKKVQSQNNLNVNQKYQNYNSGFYNNNASTNINNANSKQNLKNIHSIFETSGVLSKSTRPTFSAKSVQNKRFSMPRQNSTATGQKQKFLAENSYSTKNLTNGKNSHIFPGFNQYQQGQNDEFDPFKINNSGFKKQKQKRPMTSVGYLNKFKPYQDNIKNYEQQQQQNLKNDKSRVQTAGLYNKNNNNNQYQNNFSQDQLSNIEEIKIKENYLENEDNSNSNSFQNNQNNQQNFNQQQNNEKKMDKNGKYNDENYQQKQVQNLKYYQLEGLQSESDQNEPNQDFSQENNNYYNNNFNYNVGKSQEELEIEKQIQEQIDQIDEGVFSNEKQQYIYKQKNNNEYTDFFENLQDNYNVKNKKIREFNEKEQKELNNYLKGGIEDFI